ncbi:MAG: hypothetical protein HY399_05900 [Elusimicrobia bacterium]|nr:hypothetical protein [Elusimicrobiota bacterium]
MGLILKRQEGIKSRQQEVARERFYQKQLARENLTQIRTAILARFEEDRGAYPKDLSGLVPKYLQDLPVLQLSDHPRTKEVMLYGDEACTRSRVKGGWIDGTTLKDTGKWGYVNDKKSTCWGRVFIDCTHVDPKGEFWFLY